MERALERGTEEHVLSQVKRKANRERSSDITDWLSDPICKCITCLDVFPLGPERVIVLVTLGGRHAQVDLADVEHHGRLHLLDVGDRAPLVHDSHLLRICCGSENVAKQKRE